MWIPQPRPDKAQDKTLDKTLHKAKAKGGKPEVPKGVVTLADAGVDETDVKTLEGKNVTAETQEKRTETTLRPMLANSGAMSTFVGPFDVTSRLTGQTYQCRFSHMWNGIATRHSDTIDTKFFVNGAAIVVGLAHTGFVKFRDRTGRDLTDREASFIAAEFLCERLEEEDERPLYDVSQADVLRLIEQIGIK
jgi:hypothetical protein